MENFKSTSIWDKTPKLNSNRRNHIQNKTKSKKNSTDLPLLKKNFF